MLLTLSTTHVPATDLGFLLHKNPARAQTVDVSTGTAHVFYPEASEQRCTVALLLEVDPIALVRGARGTAAEGRRPRPRGPAAAVAPTSSPPRQLPLGGRNVRRALPGMPG